jgi:type VII secretion-associated serine protease mycosin
VLKPVPWPQLEFDPQSVWQFSTGAGVTVGVVDTGVDAGVPQLGGHVATGTTFAGGSNGNTDCVGHGTQVAGIIVAQASGSVGFEGLAPDSKVLPITAAQAIDDAQPGSQQTPPDAKTLAKAINYAVGHGAGVINVSIVVHTDDPSLQDAVANAIAHNVLVVAAVGNAPNSGSSTPYPAAYPGVLGVSGVAQDGSVLAGVQAGSYVGLVAPGASVTTTQRGGGLVTVSGTDYATAFVSATAALVRARWPNLGPDELIRRLEGTATPMAGGPTSPQYGYGEVNPYRAVTETMMGGSPRPLPAYHAPHRSRATVARARAWTDSGHLALLAGSLGLLLAACVIGAAVAIPRGRRRRWRAHLTVPPRDNPEDDLPSPPVELFDKPVG